MNWLDISGIPRRFKAFLLKYRVVLLGAALIVLLVCVVGSNIILSPGTIMYGDFNTPRELDRFELYPMWTEYGQYSNLDKTDRLLGFGIPINLAMIIGIPTETFIKMMILGTLTVAGLASYVAALWIGRKAWPGMGDVALVLAAVCVSVVYMFNPWSMNRIEHYFLWTGYALAPIIFIGAMKGLGDHDVKTLVLTGLLWTVGSTSVHYTLFLGILIAGAFAYHMVGRSTWEQRTSSLKSLSLLTLVFLVSSMYWIVPYILSILEGAGGPSSVLTVEVLDMLSFNSDPFNVIRGVGYWWPRVDIVAHGGLEIVWEIVSLVVPVVAYAALVFRRDRLTLFLVGMALIFTFLSLGTNWPLGGIYVWLTFDSPFGFLGWVLRDPDKWSGPLFLIYSMLMVLTILGLTDRLKGKWKLGSEMRNEAVAAGVVVAMVLSCFALYAGPSVNGYLNDIYAPVEIPSEYLDTNDWLASLEGDFNVLWLPTSTGLATNWTTKMVANLDNMYSGKPDIGGTSLYGAYYRSFLSQTLAENKTDHFGRYLSTAGVKYLVLRDDIPSLLDLTQDMRSSLAWQKDMTLVRDDGALHVYEVMGEAVRAYATENKVTVLGSLDDLRALNWVDGFDPVRTGILFPQQEKGSSFSTGTLLMSNAQTEDLVLLEGKGQVISPFDSTDHHDPDSMWSKASTLDRLHANWRDYLLQMGIEGWDLDYGRGLVLTWANSTDAGSVLDLSVKVPSEGNYLISTRYLENVQGGSFVLALDGEEVATIDAGSSLNRFRWSTLEDVHMAAGEHILSLRNIGGFNAVNLIMINDGVGWDTALSSASSILSSSENVYVMEAGRNMGGDPEVNLHYSGRYSQGSAVSLSPGQEVTGTMNVLDGRDLRMVAVGDGDIQVLIDGTPFQANGDFLDGTYVGTVNLTTGEHLVAVRNTGGANAIFDSLWLHSANASELSGIFDDGTDSVNVTSVDTSDPTHYRVRLNGYGEILVVTGTVYDGDWALSFEGQEVVSRPVGGYLNGFIINVSGDADVTVEYKPQSWLASGIPIAVIGTALLVPGLFLWKGWRGQRKFPGKGV